MTKADKPSALSAVRTRASGVIRLRIAPLARFVETSTILPEINASPICLMLWSSGCLSLIGGESAALMLHDRLGHAAFLFGAVAIIPISCMALHYLRCSCEHGFLIRTAAILTVLAVVLTWILPAPVPG
ncbi:MAG: hypothetical protein ABF932_14295 [Gluconobacter potus]|uniref:Uncharacterized protein n=2 Tax=Gluconobacter potus TaxID=2724927 RepID=A0ABR9YQ83_9PROT|nr:MULTISPECIES: hypothetical protein [Gluconobacter]MBF0852239.1 hypothetical protein [Gluconobacter sp. R75690]MBF0865902.1 hypothetical protein [Gluconobacter sp. R71656]MBF0868989.1 hypothetical protein [Gluconobacter sp. R75628]MBF0874966.1 hypothetical protein [Gluconobacter sp. R75629]MBF0880935.1 hypothetical protein [Gluconobacter sp. R75828]